MVWAVSQDVKDGKYSRAIGRAAGRKYTSLPDVDFGSTTPDDGLIKTVTRHPQCKWTNCGESCPANWIRMTRNDKEARKGEYMTDDTYCSEGFHQLCCPPEGDTPTCGWYQHNGGKCNSQCPDGTVEVGSLSKHCNNKKYQAACCTTGGTNMKLYNQCSWSESYPNCDSGQCSSGNKEIVKSSSGSGAVGMCKVRKTFSNGGKDAEERKYCCAQTDNQEWSDCEWYRDLGPGSGDEDFCRSGCPSDRVRVAMSGAFHFLDETNCRRGAMANCCIPKHSTISKRESAKDEILRDALTQFMKSPVCVDDDMGFKSLSIRDTNTSISDAKSELRDDSAKETSRLSHLHKHLHGRSSHPHSLEHRHHHEHHTRNIQPRSSYEKNTIVVLVSELLMGLATLNQIGIWDAIVPKTYPNLKWSSIEAWVRKEDAMERYGRSQLAYLITCDMADFDDWVGGSGTHHCECDTPACCIDGGDYCVEEDSDPELDSSSLEARHLARDDSYMALDERAGKRSRPGEPRNYTVPFPNGSGPPVELESLRYYPGTDRYWRNTGI